MTACDATTDGQSLEDGVSSDSEPLVYGGPAPHVYAVRERETSMYNQASRNCGVLCFTFMSLLACVVSFFYCQQCLFMVLIISACLCPFFHPMNAPLWLAIVLLTVGGWNFTVGALTVTWH